MRKGWPALSEEDVDGWIARFSEGVTQRANAVVPLAVPSDVPAALARVEDLYRERGLPAVFQVGPEPRPVELDRLLEERDYAYGSPTVLHTATVETVLGAVPVRADASLADAPDSEWLDLWWAVDGRGDEQALAVAVKVLTGGAARYATVRDGDAVVGVGRLALVGERGGLYCLAVDPRRRGEGFGAAVLRALVDDARRHGVTRLWLQVRAENTAARGLYERAGFRAEGRYHYRTLRLGG